MNRLLSFITVILLSTSLLLAGNAERLTQCSGKDAFGTAALADINSGESTAVGKFLETSNPKLVDGDMSCWTIRDGEAMSDQFVHDLMVQVSLAIQKSGAKCPYISGAFKYEAADGKFAVLHCTQEGATFQALYMYIWNNQELVLLRAILSLDHKVNHIP